MNRDVRRPVSAPGPGGGESRRSPSPFSARRRGALPPSRRAIDGVLQWIDEAHASQRTWARNALIGVLAFAGLVWLALWLGLLSP